MEIMTMNTDCIAFSFSRQYKTL